MSTSYHVWDWAYWDIIGTFSDQKTSCIFCMEKNRATTISSDRHCRWFFSSIWPISLSHYDSGHFMKTNTSLIDTSRAVAHSQHVVSRWLNLQSDQQVQSITTTVNHESMKLASQLAGQPQQTSTPVQWTHAPHSPLAAIFRYLRDLMNPMYWLTAWSVCLPEKVLYFSTLASHFIRHKVLQSSWMI